MALTPSVDRKCEKRRHVIQDWKLAHILAQHEGEHATPPHGEAAMQANGGWFDDGATGTVLPRPQEAVQVYAAINSRRKMILMILCTQRQIYQSLWCRVPGRNHGKRNICQCQR